MVKKFIIHLMSVAQGLHDYEVNCANADQANGIAEGLFPKDRIIDIEEVK